MASTGMFVLIIWVNDDPIKGNVVKVTNIAEPRKAFNEYSVGEKVTAKCPGFRGVHNGVIAMIGSLEEKQQLEDCLKGDQFNQLVKTYVNKDQEERTEKIPDKTSSKTPVVEKPVVPVKKRKIQKEQSTPKPVEKNLETVARELEVTELHQQLEENRYLPISQVIRESMDILVTDSRPATPERDVCIDCTVLQEQVQSNTHQICGLQNQLQSYNSQLLSTKSQLQSSLNLNQSLQHQLSNLQYYVQIMWSKNPGWFQSSRNDPSTCYRGESSFQQDRNNNQQISTPQPSTPQPSTPQPSTPKSSTTQSSTPQPSTTQLTPQSSTPQSSTPQSTDHHTSLNRVTFATSQNETLDISCIPVSTTPMANSSFIQQQK
ncbi:myb-like protein K [Mytilus edulis]|uniref:myb-like protein K n=1 Tax=Mytilus edulis TaxID=6550 RepID=UPI0039EE0DDA